MILRLAAAILVLVVVVCPVCAQVREPPPDTMEARVLACAACHGPQGQGTKNDYFPRLAGKPAGYLYNQLIAFWDGRRRYPPMNYLIEFLPEAYLREMADYYAAQRPPLPPRPVSVVSEDVLARGRALVANGDPANGIPACSNCHGPSLTGMEPAFPASSDCARPTSPRSSAPGATAPAPPPRQTACRWSRGI